MPTANGKKAQYDIGELEAALQAETTLRLRTDERLHRVQEEFQEFILNAAHDLREPLRMVNAYSELLTRKDPAPDSADAEQFRHYIMAGTGKIQNLIAGMAEYATAGAESRYILRVEVADALREAMQHQASAATLASSSKLPPVTHDPLPVVKGDSEKLVRIFRHLLDNAAKYCDDPEPRIHVSSRREGAQWVLMVQDNGSGIDEAYRERIFTPFKRLHGRQHPGVGLGLSVCQKAVESHGGRIWVESRPGKGSIFCFTLPAAD